MKEARELLDFIDKSPSMFHAVHNAAVLLEEAGFTRLKRSDDFILEDGKGYYTEHNGSALIAWRMGRTGGLKNGFRIIASHGDSPGFKIKPQPEICIHNHYVTVNTEVYGAPILSTWFDRPLSAAGRVVLKGGDLLNPDIRLIDFEKPLFTIANLAIHMNREVNEGVAINKQKDILPLLAVLNGDCKAENFLTELIADTLHVKAEDIADFDLYLYCTQKGCFTGAQDEFFSAGKIDNLGMAYPSIKALALAQPADFIQTAVIFDNEEVGSASAQGAGSPFFADTLHRIAAAVYKEGAFERLQQALSRSFLISADQAHAFHPNYPEKNDITNFPLINGGPVIKNAASMSYTSDAVSSSVFKELCRRASVPFQTFVNRSDIRGGSTIGPVSSAQVHIKSVDIGNPVLAMHSIRELAGTRDQEAIFKVFAELYRG
ncbi:M18 family aminopeptidase [Treponema sp. HNW]|uniref:M18 family aminopeptidase n=1 Tax=Treponema sp. HNW TaxID=3116654 RepID=UPI003D0CE848